MLTYMHRMIEGRIFSLIDMPFIAVWASQYMSIYVALCRFARDLVTWYPKEETILYQKLSPHIFYAYKRKNL